VWAHARRRAAGRVSSLAARQGWSRAAVRAQATTHGKAGRTGLLHPGPHSSWQATACGTRAPAARSSEPATGRPRLYNARRRPAGANAPVAVQRWDPTSGVNALTA
jgi:hypothetical protein